MRHCRPGAFPVLSLWLLSEGPAFFLADASVTRYWVAEYCDISFWRIFVLCYLIVFISDFVIRKCHSERILISNAFVDSFRAKIVFLCIFCWTLVSLFNWLDNCLAGWSGGWFILVLNECSLGDTMIISLLGWPVTWHSKFERMLVV